MVLYGCETYYLGVIARYHLPLCGNYEYVSEVVNLHKNNYIVTEAVD